MPLRIEGRKYRAGEPFLRGPGIDPDRHQPNKPAIKTLGNFQGRK